MILNNSVVIKYKPGSVAKLPYIFPFDISLRDAYMAMIQILANCRKSIEKTKKEIKAGYEFCELNDMKWYLLRIIPDMEWKNDLLTEACKCYGLRKVEAQEKSS